MKKKIIYACLVYIILPSCKKDYSTTNQPNSLVNNQEVLENIKSRDYQIIHSNKAHFVSNAGSLGFWALDSFQLPVFNFTAQLPIKTFEQTGRQIDYPEDPWFLLGNYRLNCFVHNSGAYQLMSMERAISRLNYAGAVDSAFCRSTISYGEKKRVLAGLNSKLAINPRTEKSFGPGYATFKYDVEENISLRRTLSTLPSQSINEGCPAILITIEVENKGELEQTFSYNEGLDAAYKMAMNVDQVNYPVSTTIDREKKRIIAKFTPTESKSRTTGNTKDDFSLAEGFPPSVFIQALTSSPEYSIELSSNKINNYKTSLDATANFTIKPKDKVQISFIVGYSYDYLNDNIDDIVSKLTADNNRNTSDYTFRKEWRNVIPELSKETDVKMRTEMQWHAAMLESMATYSDYYKETFIPQGTVYEYAYGVSCCLNDISVFSLPLNYYNPELAKSIIRYTLKHSDAYGFMHTADMGAGRMAIGSNLKSNSYPYTLFALAEYFRANQNPEFLFETLSLRYNYGESEISVVDLIERLIIFCRDEIGVGMHGLPKLLDSDWNDSFYYFFKDLNFHQIFRHAESHMNATMLVLYLSQISENLKQIDFSCEDIENQDRISVLIQIIDEYKTDLLDELVKDIGDNNYVNRAYIKDLKIGEDNLFLEPQIFAVGIKELPMEKRKKIWQTTKTKLWDNEKKGARQNEKGCETEFELSQPGKRENGGFWYSLNGPLIVNLIDVDRDAAIAGLNKMSLMQHGEDFPDYWPGMWSGGDSFDSSMVPSEGLTDAYLYPFPVFCAHAHSWSLWGYYRLFNN